MDTGQWYRSGTARWWQLFTDAQVAGVVVMIVLGVWLRRPVPLFGLVLALAFIRGWRRVAALGLAGGMLGCALSIGAWESVKPDELGPFAGWSCLVTDPAPVAGASAAVFEIDGERFETWARGSIRRRLERHLAGECARVVGVRVQLSPQRSGRAAPRHIVGGFIIESVGDWTSGSRLDRASNRVRRLFADGAAFIPVPDDALYAGLVIGDDRHEPPEMIDQFRRSGLSHLTAVSGSNVAFLLAAAAPLLRRLRPWARWLTTIAVIGWFVALTRFEPSILRAGVMAAIASTGYLLGREKPPGRVLALAVGLLILVDPLLVWSVGFWLSVAATAGVALLGGPLGRLLPGPGWLTTPLGITLGAQIAVAPITLLVFGTLPLVSIPANLLAVPVAGFVMLYGLPAGLTAGAVSGLGFLGPGAGHVSTIIQLPAAMGTRWVATVAALASHLEPPSPWPMIGWSAAIAFCVFRALSARLGEL